MATGNGRGVERKSAALVRRSGGAHPAGVLMAIPAQSTTRVAAKRFPDFLCKCPTRLYDIMVL